MARRIVIIDEITTRRIYMRAFLESCGHEVFDGYADSLPRLAHLLAAPSLVIVSADAGKQAWRFARANLNRAFANEHVPILLLTDDYNARTRASALRAGIDEILPRPINEPIARARIRNLMRDTAAGREQQSRECVASELGFSETPADFQRPSLVWDVVYDGGTGALSKLHLQLPNTRLEEISCGDLLDCIENAPACADLILLPPELTKNCSILNTVAEARSRERSRYASIVVRHHPDDREAALTSLDVGANDAIETDSMPSEYVSRLALQLQRKRKSDYLRNMIERGLELATHDELTGLFNRRYAAAYLDKIAGKSQQDCSSYAVLALDMDRFKQINDRFGHATGDKVLRDVAQRLKENVRAEDLLARTGGEEFLIVMPDTDLNSAMLAADRIRRVIGSDRFSQVDGPGIRVTASIGVSICRQSMLMGFSQGEDPVQRADRALLLAKADGRDLVRFCTVSR